MANRKWQGSILLLLTAFIWGAAFVAQKIGIVDIGVFTFSASRFMISGIALLPVIMLRKKHKQLADITPEKKKSARKTLIAGGVICGILLAMATNVQQMGIADTTAGKAGFITTLYIVFVPILRVFNKKKVSGGVWISVAAAVAGLYLLSVKEGFSINQGDALVLLCALFFTFHILVIDKYSPQTDGVKMSCIQFFTAALFSAILMLVFERPSLSAVLACWAPILYLGVVSGAIGYTLQIIGQRDTDPAAASLILSLESVFAAITGVLFINESFTAKELIGCVFVFGATILSQVSTQRQTLFRGIKEKKGSSV